MPLRRRRSHYQQLTEFERGRAVGLREGGFLSAIFQKDLAGMYPLCMIVGSSGQGKVLTHEDRVPGGHVALLRGKTTVFGVWLWRIVQRLGQKFELQLAPQRRNKSVTSRTALSQTPCSVYSTDSKPLSFAM
ncbi:hypothetical protein AVEN_46030-1 [Araneus ventricosus]|uniref:Uncharacterized protein n=1 Tax=Araneus ventricosus TaxID=182803 RepID=A0A4Y2E684_ARAVE|nr:hypothetical protein AVEN_46030-1 [Araneus ventricosus]